MSECVNQCKTCRGKGAVLVDLRRLGFGAGFVAFMSAGTAARRNEDGSAHHEIVCPECDGKGVTEGAGG